MPANTSWNAGQSRTQADFGDEIFDGISTNNALVWLLRQAGNIKVTEGGRTFTHPLIWSLNSSFGARGALDTIPTPDPDVLTRSEWSVKTISGSITISKLEEAQNQGKAAIIKLLQEKKMEASISMSEILGDQLVDGTGIGDEWDSLETIISATNTTTVGGIAGSDASWQNYANTTGTAAFNTGSAGLSLMDTALNGTTFGSKGPRAIFTTAAIYTLYYISQAGNVRYYNEELADAGFKHLNFSTLPVLRDDNIDAGRMYFVDTDSTWLQVLSKGNMVTTEFIDSSNQLSSTALMYLFGNLTTGSRRTNGVVTSITG